MKRNLLLLSKSVFGIQRKTLISNDILNKFVQIRNLSLQETIDKRNKIFEQEKKRQEDVGRIEKIEVRYMGVPKDTTLIMNKDLSTPYDCTKHLGDMLIKRSVLALVDGVTIWDMHRPLVQSCTLELLHFMISDPFHVNRTYWRTCSFILGAVAQKAFKDSYQVQLHSFPSPDVRSGSFVYDCELVGLDSWQPEKWECQALSAEYVKFCRRAAPLERLTVKEHIALDMFQDNPHKTKQIPDIARKNEGCVTLYRASDHIDISKGPMISNTSTVGRVSITAVHRLAPPVGDKDAPILHRFQGVSIPAPIVINHIAYSILEDRATRLNSAKSPLEPFGGPEDVRVSAVA